MAKLIRIAKLLLIDEATMLDRFQLEALDRSLKDLTGTDIHFGGKILLLAGAFGNVFLLCQEQTVLIL